GADHPLVASASRVACSSVSKSRMENPRPSSGSSQYPTVYPGADVTLGMMSFISAVAAAGAWLGSIVTVISTACISLSCDESGLILITYRRCDIGMLVGGASIGTWLQESIFADHTRARRQICSRSTQLNALQTYRLRSASVPGPCRCRRLG